MDFLIQEIAKVSIFLICAQMLLHFRAKDSYEKYIKLLISMMLLVFLASPFLHFGEQEASFEEILDQYEQEIQKVMADALPKETEMEAILQNITNEKLEQSLEYVAKQEAEVQETGEQEQAENVEAAGMEQVEITIETIVVGGSDG